VGAGALGAPAADRCTAGEGGAAAAGFPPPFDAPLPPFAGKASRSLRTTGGSMVEEADRTNSPISWSLAMTTLLSTPSSFASS
jgi:hypothetical protein